MTEHATFFDDDPRHGTHAGAMQHWIQDVPMCDPCRWAASRQRKRLELLALQGQPATVELGEEAWQLLVSAPRNQMVAWTGMEHTRLKNYIKTGPTQRLHRRSRDKILSFKPSWTPIGLQRRIRALAALGWSLEFLAAQRGIGVTNLDRLRRPTVRQHVKLPFAEHVLALYDEFSTKIPPDTPSSRAVRTRAARQGFHSPLAWDEDTIDDPEAVPADRYVERRGKDEVDENVVERVLSYRRPNEAVTRAERDEITARWRALGRPMKDLTRLTGWKVERYAQRDEDAA